MKLFDEAKRLDDEMKRCVKAHCKKQKKAADNERKAYAQKIMDLLTDLGNGKITPRGFYKKMEALEELRLNSAITSDLIVCDIQHCNKQLQDHMIAAANIHKIICDKRKKDCAIPRAIPKGAYNDCDKKNEPKQCDKLDEIYKIIARAKRNPTKQDYIDLFRLLEYVY